MIANNNFVVELLTVGNLVYNSLCIGIDIYIMNMRLFYIV